MMSTKTTVKHNSPQAIEHTMTPIRIENTEAAKPLLQSILQTETASAFTKQPSHAYQIEYTSNIYNPEDINSMAAASSKVTNFIPTEPTIRPMLIKTTTKMSEPTTTSTTKSPEVFKETYVQPEAFAGWPVYNLIIEGHSKVKNYGLKNVDEIGNNLPKIRPVQGKENPIVERVTKPDEGPEFSTKHSQAKKKEFDKNFKSSESSQKSPMASIWSLLDSSFGSFMSDENSDKSQLESENKIGKQKNENFKKRKTRSLRIPVREAYQAEHEHRVSFQVAPNEKEVQPSQYRKGSVITENLWPYEGAELSRYF